MMEDWKKRLLALVAKYPAQGINPDKLGAYTDGELWGIYVRLRDLDDAS